MLREGDVLDGKYKILAKIGRGGMSKVWLAMDNTLNKQWAVKEINKNTEEYKRTVDEHKTISEIEIMKRLDHPALPRIVGVIDAPGSLCVVMDYIEGETLQRVLDTSGRQSEENVAKWMLSICGVLSYLHSQDPPIIYRDMKPANIMLTPEGNVKVIDFGIARELKGDKNDTMPLGTRGYASPEHFSKNTDARSDVYTVGSTMYHLLTGEDPTQPPYEIRPIREVDPSLSTGLEKIIEKATRPNPEERYQTIQEMADAINSYRKLEVGYMEALRSRIRKFRLLGIASVVMMLLGVLTFVAGTVVENNTYNDLLTSTSPDSGVRIDKLKKAADLKPEQEEPYLALIKEYAKDGKFTEKEGADFAEFYDGKRRSLASNETRYWDINYKIGEAYLTYYTGETDSSSRAKLIAAAPYFKECLDDEFAKHELAASYCFMADYYKDYVMADATLVSKEAGRKEIDNLMKSCKLALKNLKNYEGEGSDKVTFITSDVILSLLDDQRMNAADNSIPEESYNGIAEETKYIVSLRNPTSENMSAEKEILLKRADEVMSSIKTTYTNQRKEESNA